MQLNQIKRNTKRTTSNQIGRGGKRGKTSGRGTKGQKARAGRKLRPEIRDYIKKIPKLRGYFMKSIQERPVVISLGAVSKAFQQGGEVSVETLKNANLISVKGGKLPRVKILGGGAAVKGLVLKGVSASESVKSAIEKAG